MTDLSAPLPGNRRHHIAKALYRHGRLSAEGLSERLFALLFSGLVYPQIWEDPEIDIEAMALEPGHRIATIASGGCNVLAYLTRHPARIDAVDLNGSHVALLRLKLAAARHLPAQADFFRFFGEAGNRHNPLAYDRFIRMHLDPATRAHWDGRSLAGRRRIEVFARDVYRTGLLGSFIATGHRVAKLYGVNPADIMAARDLREQRAFYEERLKPLFDTRFIRWLTSKKASLFGLGIPPAQYDALAPAGERSMAEVLSARLEKLACHFPLADNYFAWQAFARTYPRAGEALLPLYLEAGSFAAIRANAASVAVHGIGMTEMLAAKPAGSIDRYIFLDAQDWMTDAQLNGLWSEVSRTAAPGARVVFRTAGADTILPGRVNPAILARWTYEEARSRDLSARDRSAIYGGFHLYVKA